jgi:hypothetical protein
MPLTRSSRIMAEIAPFSPRCFVCKPGQPVSGLHLFQGLRNCRNSPAMRRPDDARQFGYRVAAAMVSLELPSMGPAVHED